MKKKTEQQEWIIIVGLLGFVYVGICVSCFRYGASPIEIANFVAVSLTLFVLIRYTFDTNRIANANYIAQFTPCVSHSFHVVKPKKVTVNKIDESNYFEYLDTEVYLSLVNHSLYDVKIRVFLDIIVEGRKISYIDNNTTQAYQGDRYWYVGAKSTYTGHFTFGDTLLMSNGLDPVICDLKYEEKSEKVMFILYYKTQHSFNDEEYESMKFIYNFRAFRVENAMTGSEEETVSLVPVAYAASQIVSIACEKEQYTTRNGRDVRG